jgi:hypothetical protein
MKAVILESLGIKEEQLKALEAPLTAQGISFSCYERTADQEKLKEEIGDADIAILANMPLSNEVIEAGEHLKFIDVAFTGVDHIGLEAAKEKKIAVSNASGYSNEAGSRIGGRHCAGRISCSAENGRCVPLWLDERDICRSGDQRKDGRYHRSW